MSLCLGGQPSRRFTLATIRRRFKLSQVGGRGSDLRVRVVVRATPLACTTTTGPDAEPERPGESWEGPHSPHPETGRHGGTDGGPSLRDPGSPRRFARSADAVHTAATRRQPAGADDVATVDGERR